MVTKLSFDKFWKDKKILITGHTGFKGSWLSFWLFSLGSKVYGYSLMPNYKPYCYKKLNIKKKLVNEKIDNILHLQSLKKFIRSIKPDIIFHLAAQPLVLDSYRYPIETIKVNAIGTANVLEAAKNVSSIKSIINITTDKCYENIEKKKYKYNENDKLGGYDLYSASKACSEIIISAYRQSFKQKYKNCIISSVRAGNVIGGGDWSKNRLIPDIIKSIRLKKKIFIRNPNAIRPWQHVIEPLYGYMRLAYYGYVTKNNKFATAWNFGPNEKNCVSVKKIIMHFSKKYGKKFKFDLRKKIQEHEAKYLNLDISKVKKEIFWHPKWNVTKALNYTIDWYDAIYSKKKILWKN